MLSWEITFFIWVGSLFVYYLVGIYYLETMNLPNKNTAVFIVIHSSWLFRSYLRRSRHLKSETHLPRVVSCMVDEAMLAPATPNDNYDEPKTCKVTPKDILSFAWQIANGMTYLSEIKVGFPCVYQLV